MFQEPFFSFGNLYVFELGAGWGPYWSCFKSSEEDPNLHSRPDIKRMMKHHWRVGIRWVYFLKIPWEFIVTNWLVLNHPHRVATLCSSFSRENGYPLLVCSLLSTAQVRCLAPPGFFESSSPTAIKRSTNIIKVCWNYLELTIDKSIIVWGTHRNRKSHTHMEYIIHMYTYTVGNCD